MKPDNNAELRLWIIELRNNIEKQQEKERKKREAFQQRNKRNKKNV